MSGAEPYRFNTTRQSMRTIVPSLLALGAVGTGLALLLSPGFAIAAGVYAAYGVVSNLIATIPSVRDRLIGKALRKGELERLPDSHPVSVISRDTSDRMGRAAPPGVYTLSADALGKLMLPYGFRWLRKLPPVRDSLKKAEPGFFAAVLGENMIVTTREALDAKRYSLQEMKFIIAHEMAHLKVDNFSFNAYAGNAISRAAKIAAVGLVAAALLPGLGVALPFMAAGISSSTALWGILGSYIFARGAINYGTRALERRADRNALYVTRDLDNAHRVMNALHSDEEKILDSPIANIFSSHPGYYNRMESLSDSFNKVSRYPLLPPAPTAPALKP